MLRRAIFPLLWIVAALSIASAARASGIGRHLGVGWSDGYHAKNACLPQRAGGCPNCAPDLPWWTAPGPQEGVLPPATTHARRPHPPGGPSLFRQPGAGSSVIVSETSSGNP